VDSGATRERIASDNNAGVHPEVLAAIAEANTGHAAAYGDDPWTVRAEQLLRAHFGEQASTYLVFNGSRRRPLTRLGEAEVDLRGRGVRPARRDDFPARVERDPLGPVDMAVAE
jgi:hypothetical protein